MLTGPGEKAPYVLVAQGTAGFGARVFAASYPTAAAGLVLLDAAHENESMCHLECCKACSQRTQPLRWLRPAMRARVSSERRL
jgi:hypothetical protein